METARLGRTNLQVTRTAFGALPIQRTDSATADKILRLAYEAGINFFDTARGYSDSEEKIGASLSDVRPNIIIATKSGATTKSGLLEHLETSLRKLRTDYVDILQLHNPSQVPEFGDAESSYAGLLEAKRQGKVRFVGITNHRLAVAREAVGSGMFDTVQYPFSILSADKDLELVELAKTKDVGFIAMKALSGGLITNARAAFAFLRQYQGVIPIWGIQHETELREFLDLEANPPAIDNELRKAIDKDRKELAGDFCRACGYCLPCPANIPINMAARMAMLLRRSPYERLIGPDWQEKMERIENCEECGHCKEHCPYELDTPALLRKMLVDYRQFVKEHSNR